MRPRWSCVRATVALLRPRLCPVAGCARPDHGGGWELVAQFAAASDTPVARPLLWRTPRGLASPWIALLVALAAWGDGEWVSANHVWRRPAGWLARQRHRRSGGAALDQRSALGALVADAGV